MDLVKGHSTASPEEEANRDVLLAAPPEGMERTRFSIDDLFLVDLRRCVGKDNDPKGTVGADERKRGTLPEGTLALLGTKPSDTTTETPSQKKTLIIVGRRVKCIV
ncbi:unnamed protein product [Pseudo-nitzschia multistriata]|uniref:Uncharacterized protein n=1 Tax=Pseudo-nitzschia multistriata TaxID=183589 RepID=A0A448ZS39_9STRA|nr:unnamed protein product [Pseudo-nitzschia multistriata]